MEPFDDREEEIGLINQLKRKEAKSSKKWKICTSIFTLVLVTQTAILATRVLLYRDSYATGFDTDMSMMCRLLS